MLENCVKTLCTDNQTQTQPPFYGHYRGQHALAGTSRQEVEDIVGAQVLLPACPCWRQPAHSDNGPNTIAIRARFEYDSSTIRLQHATRCVRFERDTTSYEELCAFEQ